MSAQYLLEVHRAEREALLRRLTDQLHHDEHVAAAWLAGAGVQDDAAGLRSLDLWVAVADEYGEAAIAQRRAYVTAVASPLLVEEPPEGAPAGGAHLLVLYAGRAGPHQVHWRWLLRSQARLPQGARLLVDRGGVPSAMAPGPLTRRQRAQMAGEQTMLFWALVHGAAQCIARHEPWAALSLIGRAREALHEVRSLAGCPGDDPLDQALPALAPSRQLEILRGLVQAMERLTPQVALLGARVPVQAIIQIQRFLDLAEALSDEAIAESPATGSSVAS